MHMYLEIHYTSESWQLYSSYLYTYNFILASFSMFLIISELLKGEKDMNDKYAVAGKRLQVRA